VEFMFGIPVGISVVEVFILGDRVDANFDGDVVTVMIVGAGTMDGTGDIDLIVGEAKVVGSFVGKSCAPPGSGASVILGASVGPISPNGTVVNLFPPSLVGTDVSDGSIVLDDASGVDVTARLGTLPIIFGAFDILLIGADGIAAMVGGSTAVGTKGVVGTVGDSTVGSFKLGVLVGIFPVVSGEVVGCISVTAGACVIPLRVGGESSCRSKIRSCTS
jgi:hypothetical protein